MRAGDRTSGAPSATRSQPRLVLALNTETVSPGGTLTLALGFEAGFPDAENVGDLYVGVLVPGGAAYLLTSGGFALAFDGTRVVSGGLQAFRYDTTLSTGLETILDTVVAWPLPPGQYTFVAVLVTPGTAVDDAGNWLSNLAAASFSVAAPLGAARESPRATPDAPEVRGR